MIRPDRSLPPAQRALARGAPLFGLFLVLVAILVLAAGTGSVSVPPGTIAKIIVSRIPGLGAALERDWSPAFETIVWQIRVPRVLLSGLAGASLAAAGAAFQGLFRNPMADPYVLGASSGASVGAALAVIFAPALGFLGLGTVPVAAFAGAALAVILVYAVARSGGRVAVLSLLLAGVAVGSFLSAVVSLLIFLSARDEKLWQIVFWLMGGFSGATWAKFWTALPYAGAAVGVMIILARDLNALALGEEDAHHLGVNVEATKKALLAAGSLATGVSVAVGGVIGFVGLVVPHAVRLAAGPDHRLLLPVSALAGAAFLVAADTLARTVLSPTELPVGIVTSFVGAPFFIYLLARRRGGLGE